MYLVPVEHTTKMEITIITFSKQQSFKNQVKKM